MQQSACRAEVCYPFGRKHGRHRVVRRRAFITPLGGVAARRARHSRRGQPNSQFEPFTMPPQEARTGGNEAT